MPENRKLFFSCEHGGNLVPPAYEGLFHEYQEELCSHRGFDRGALSLARMLAAGLGAPLECSEITRLLVDLNRSLNNFSLFSAPTRKLSSKAKKQLLHLHYLPYRTAVCDQIGALIATGAQVLHLSVHSFTPSLHGQVRNAELGLLYDPARNAEKCFSRDWKRLLVQQAPQLKIRYNYPYRGTADGLTRTLRHQFAAWDYLGIELEVNQALLGNEACFSLSLQGCLLETLRDLTNTD